MKIFHFFSFFLLLIKILSQTSNNINNTSNNQLTNTTSQNNNTKKNISLNIPNNNKTKAEEKPFNLTESLFNFFKETIHSLITKENNDTKQKTKKEEDINKRTKEQQENLATIEKIQIETNKKLEKIRQYEEERNIFMRMLSNNSFEEVLLINLPKGESETLYLDLKTFSKIKLAIFVSDSDQEEKINFFFSGPNPRGHTMVIQNYYNKNYFLWEYDTPRSGEYYVEITNKGTKDNEIYFMFSDIYGKKKDLLDMEKIDKISMLLNNIDSNINQLRNKKKIEIKQANSHNDKVTENNRWIVIYSIIEIFTMILVFLIQSYYINSLVNKV